ncbi:MAG: homocysteine S-methyltransferase family protein [Chthoniobacter sp.]|uniref:homocysteine S-methyltransferase family protein n=1 Tax=Chthoniobacter sp. TaxID=2510640 RepID=UPI0032A25820
MDFLDELQHRVLLGDGAMGTELLAAGVPAGRCLEELCVSEPDLVRGVHDRYIEAGARLIETNTFGANAVRLAQHGCEHRVSEINWTAAQLAKDVAKGKDVYVAGCVGPLGITAEEAAARGIDRHEVFTEQIGALLDGGCRIIFLETFLDAGELLIALEAKQALHHCPVVALLTGNDPEKFQAAVAKVRAAEAEVVGVNCVDGNHALHLLEGLDAGELLAAFPSAGLPQSHDSQLVYATSPQAFATNALALAERGVRLLGGCCGVGPKHIAAMAVALRETVTPD